MFKSIWEERKGRAKIVLSILVVSIMLMPLLMDNVANANVKTENKSTSEKTEFIKNFDGTSWGSSVIQTSDGMYLISGGTGYYEGSDALLIKTGGEGDVIWKKTFGDSSGWDGFWGGLLEANDGNYVASGTKNMTSYLVKVNPSNGDSIWERLYGLSKNGSIIDFQETSDDGFILTGRVYDESRRGWLIKTDSEGKEIWNKTLGGEFPVTLSTIRITDDGGYILAGLENNPNKAFPVSYAIKTDALGNIEWENTYNSCHEFRHGIVQTSDGGFIFAGEYAIVPRLNINQICLLKSDSEGNEIWSEYYGTPIFSEVSFWIEETNDDGYIVIGYYLGLGTLINFIQKGDYHPFWSKIWLLKFNATDNLEWDKKLGTGIGRCVRQTSDGDYILTGQKGAYNKPKGIIFIKTDENGNII
jgi:hypothetical protein